MAVSLTKGQKVELTKTNPGLSKIVVGLGWDTNKYEGGAEFDLDAVAFLLNASGKVDNDADFIYHRNLKHASGSVIHTGDNRTGVGDGDDEQILVDLSKVPASVEKITFAVCIYDAEKHNQNFGQVHNAFIHIMEPGSNAELMRYDLGEDFSTETSIVAAELYRHNGEWKFSAIGSGWTGGLYKLCTTFGVNV